MPQSKVDKDQSNVEESIKNVMVALAKGGRKWTVRPAGEETESWLLRMLGGEVAWIEDSEDTPCPIQ